MNEAGRAAEAIRAALAEIDSIIDHERDCDCDLVRKHFDMVKQAIADMDDKAEALRIRKVLIGALGMLPTGVVGAPHTGLGNRGASGRTTNESTKFPEFANENDPWFALKDLRERYGDGLNEAIVTMEALAMMATEPSDQASLTHGQAAALYWQRRGYNGTEGSARSRICKKLTSPEHRVGKQYLRQSVLNLAAADEAAAADKVDEKTKKEIGKNKKTVTHKF